MGPARLRIVFLVANAEADRTSNPKRRKNMLRHDYVSCAWRPFKQELLLQWRLLSEQDLAGAGPNRRNLARVIAEKYGIASRLAEGYLARLELAMTSAGAV
jgi:hypothetical protein